MADRSVNSAAVSTVHRETAKGLVPLVAIDGGVATTGGLTDSQLRAAPVPTTETRGISAATITTNTTAVTGTFAAITVLSDAVFTSLTRANTTGSLGSTTVPAGVTIFGDITGYQLASGAVIAYGA